MTLEWTTVDTLQNDLDRAAAPFDRERAGLFRDGKPVYAPDVHHEKLANLEARRAAALGAITDRARERAEEEMGAIATEEARIGRDPLLSLDAAGLTRAAALREFIAEDVAGLPLARLANYLEAVRLRGDRVEMAVVARAAARRLDTPTRELLDERGYTEAGAALQQLRAALVTPEETKAREALRARRTKASEIASWAARNAPGYEAALAQRFPALARL